MIHHLGTRIMKYFGKLDLTAGFHQIGIDVKSRKYAAFIANRKIYQPTRVFMGLKNSPANFQDKNQGDITMVLARLSMRISLIFPTGFSNVRGCALVSKSLTLVIAFHCDFQDLS
jgi:hypothetical protein